jgi:hypothetical protein
MVDHPVSGRIVCAVKAENPVVWSPVITDDPIQA